MNYVVDKVKGGVKRGCVHFDTPSFFVLSDISSDTTINLYDVNLCSPLSFFVTNMFYYP